MSLPAIPILSALLTHYSFMTATVMPLSNALEGYELFDSMEVQKVIFDAER